MGGHQYIGVKVNRVLLVGLTEVIEVELVIFFSKETSSPIVAPLDEVHRISRKLESWAFGHGYSRSEY